MPLQPSSSSPARGRRSRQRHPHHVFALILVLLVVAMSVPGLAGEVLAQAWRGSEETRDGVAHVLNPADPMAGEKTLRPEVTWRLGGESEADEELFGMVQTVLVDEKGEVYVLDVQLNEVRVFSPQGEYLRTLGREGEGPGEFRNASALFFLDGQRLAVAQLMPTRIAVLDRETGAGLADLALPESEGSMMNLIEQAEGRAGRIVMSIMSPIMAEDGLITRRRMSALNEAGESIGVLREHEEKQTGTALRIGGDEEENWFRNWRLGADGRVFVAPFYQGYEIYVLGRDGAVDRVIEREYEPLKRSDEEMERLERQSEDLPDVGMELEQDVKPYHRDVAGLYPRDDGSLWVLTSRGRSQKPEGALGVFDVFDPQGRFLRQVTVFADYNDEYDEFLFRGEQLFVIKEANSGAGITSSSGGHGGGMMMMVRRGGSPDGEEEDEREPLPLEIVRYDLKG